MKKNIFVFLFFIPLLISIVFAINVQSSTGNSINESITDGSIITGETITGEAAEASLAVSIAVLALPTLTIIKPENETYLTITNLLLNYSARGEDYVWYNIDLLGDNTTITSSVNFNTTEGVHTLYLYANNSEGEVSKNITFTVNSSKFKVYYNEWFGANKGASTDFNKSSYKDIQSLSDVVLEHTDWGKIVFNEAINITEDEDMTDNQVDISSYTNISENRIEVNITGLSNFNKAATLRLYNLTLDAPVRILRDGSVCSSAICTQQSYTGGTLVFNVTQFSVYSSEETPGVTPPGGGGGGIITKKSFILSTDSLSAKLEQGHTAKKTFTITNTGTRKLKFTIENPTLKDFLQISETSFELNSKESKTIILNITTKEDTFPNLYIGKLIIKAEGLEKEILVAVEIESLEALFDVTLEIPKRYLEVAIGEEILADIKIYNLGEIGRVDAEIEYIIKDENNNVVTTASDTIAVETQTSFTKTILITKNAKYGRHMFYVRVTYNSKVASASVFFEIAEPRISSKEKIYIVSIIFLIIFISILVYYFIRHRIKMHRKIVKKIDIKDLLRI